MILRQQVVGAKEGDQPGFPKSVELYHCDVLALLKDLPASRTLQNSCSSGVAAGASTLALRLEINPLVSTIAHPPVAAMPCIVQMPAAASEQHMQSEMTSEGKEFLKPETDAPSGGPWIQVGHGLCGSTTLQYPESATCCTGACCTCQQLCLTEQNCVKLRD